MVAATRIGGSLLGKDVVRAAGDVGVEMYDVLRRRKADEGARIAGNSEEAVGLKCFIFFFKQKTAYDM